jgi:integrase/recombinase XerD
LTPQEEDALLGRFLPANTPLRLRNLVMVRLMLNAGLRASEVVNLKRRDLELTEGKLMVRQGKGGKDRTLWIGDDDLALLRQWLEARPPGLRNDYVFVTGKGRKVPDRFLRYLVKRKAAEAGIDKDIHPHTLRHSFATDLLRATGNIRLVQKALGHASIATTEIYLHIHDEELMQAMKEMRHGQAHPG